MNVPCPVCVGKVPSSGSTVAVSAAQPPHRDMAAPCWLRAMSGPTRVPSAKHTVVSAGSARNQGWSPMPVSSTTTRGRRPATDGLGAASAPPARARRIRTSRTRPGRPGRGPRPTDCHRPVLPMTSGGSDPPSRRPTRAWLAVPRPSTRDRGPPPQSHRPRHCGRSSRPPPTRLPTESRHATNPRQPLRDRLLCSQTGPSDLTGELCEDVPQRVAEQRSPAAGRGGNDQPFGVVHRCRPGVLGSVMAAPVRIRPVMRSSSPLLPTRIIAGRRHRHVVPGLAVYR